MTSVLKYFLKCKKKFFRKKIYGVASAMLAQTFYMHKSHNLKNNKKYSYLIVYLKNCIFILGNYSAVCEK